MSIATLTSKGQITLPKNIRTKLRLKVGEKISFQLDEASCTAILSPMNHTVDEVFGILHVPGKTKPRSIEEMNRAILDKFKKEHL